jgi:hypothetical protein
MIFSPAFTCHSYGVLGDLVDWQAKISMAVTIFQSSKYETGLWGEKNKSMDVQHIWETQYREDQSVYKHLYGSCDRLSFTKWEVSRTLLILVPSRTTAHQMFSWGGSSNRMLTVAWWVSDRAWWMTVLAKDPNRSARTVTPHTPTRWMSEMGRCISVELEMCKAARASLSKGTDCSPERSCILLGDTTFSFVCMLSSQQCIACLRAASAHSSELLAVHKSSWHGKWRLVSDSVSPHASGPPSWREEIRTKNAVLSSIIPIRQF